MIGTMATSNVRKTQDAGLKARRYNGKRTQDSPFAEGAHGGVPRNTKRASLRGLRSQRGDRAVESGLLAGEDEELSIVHGRVLQNAVAQIQDVAVAIEFGDDVQSGLANFLRRSEKDRGIEIALDSDARAGKRAKFAEWHAPIDAEDIGAGFDHGREKMMRGFCVINHGDGVAEARDDFLNGGQNELVVVVEIEFAAPSVEQLNGRDASGDLRL